MNICPYCKKRIDPSIDEFEEIGSIEFAHTECRDRVEGIEETPHGEDMAYLLGNSAN